jgi:syntaxin 7
MSFDQLSSLEAGRRSSPGFSDDPEFQRLSQDLRNKLFKLSGNNQRLKGELGHLGTRRDTPRVRERVHELLQESRDLFKDVGEGVKKVQTWEDVTVRIPVPTLTSGSNTTNTPATNSRRKS